MKFSEKAILMASNSAMLRRELARKHGVSEQEMERHIERRLSELKRNKPGLFKVRKSRPRPGKSRLEGNPCS